MAKKVTEEIDEIMEEDTEERTINQIEIEIREALENKEYKMASKLAKELYNLNDEIERKEIETRQNALSGLAEKVMDAIGELLDDYRTDIENAGGEGIWFEEDWGEGLTTIRLIKVIPAPKKKRGRKPASETE